MVKPKAYLDCIVASLGLKLDDTAFIKYITLTYQQNKKNHIISSSQLGLGDAVDIDVRGVTPAKVDTFVLKGTKKLAPILEGRPGSAVFTTLPVTNRNCELKSVDITIYNVQPTGYSISFNVTKECLISLYDIPHTSYDYDLVNTPQLSIGTNGVLKYNPMGHRWKVEIEAKEGYNKELEQRKMNSVQNANSLIQDGIDKYATKGCVVPRKNDYGGFSMSSISIHAHISKYAENPKTLSPDKSVEMGPSEILAGFKPQGNTKPYALYDHMGRSIEMNEDIYQEFLRCPVVTLKVSVSAKGETGVVKYHIIVSNVNNHYLIMNKTLKAGQLVSPDATTELVYDLFAYYKFITPVKELATKFPAIVNFRTLFSDAYYNNILLNGTQEESSKYTAWADKQQTRLRSEINALGFDNATNKSSRVSDIISNLHLHKLYTIGGSYVAVYFNAHTNIAKVADMLTDKNDNLLKCLIVAVNKSVVNDGHPIKMGDNVGVQYIEFTIEDWFEFECTKSIERVVNLLKQNDSIIRALNLSGANNLVAEDRGKFPKAADVFGVQLSGVPFSEYKSMIDNYKPED